MKQRNILLVGLMAVGLVTILILGILQTNRVDAETTTFTQQVLPLDCVFETVNDGLGTIHYLTPAECGQAIPPTDEVPYTLPTPIVTIIPKTNTKVPQLISPYVPTNSANTHANGHVDENISGNGRALLLNSIADAFSDKGFTVTIREGDIIFYRLTDNKNAPIRSVLFDDIKTNSVRFDVNPLNLKVSVLPNQTVQFDKLADGTPAVALELQKVSGSTATLIIKLHSDVPNHTRATAANVRLVVISVLAASLLVYDFRAGILRFIQRIINPLRRR